ncbi:PEP-CTERM sorting domain-containing protein [candidate division KSB1 bacterium]|nr:PEP-CTERM sorting domain-containing protein [candidate division KSB1 bacterium]
MKKTIILSVILFFVCVSSGWTLTGSIQYIDGITGLIAGDGWNNSQTILQWNVNQNPDLTWTYEYSFSSASPMISHAIIEISPNFTTANILAGTTVYDELKTYTPNQGNSNPGLYGDLYGIKWNGESSWQIITDRAPMWGHFYAKGGRTYAYNSAFPGFVDGGYNPALRPTFNIDNYIIEQGWVLVPDTESSVVPEPGTLMLLGIGFLGLVISRIRFFRNKNNDKQKAMSVLIDMAFLN